MRRKKRESLKDVRLSVSLLVRAAATVDVALYVTGRQVTKSNGALRGTLLLYSVRVAWSKWAMVA